MDDFYLLRNYYALKLCGVGCRIKTHSPVFCSGADRPGGGSTKGTCSGSMSFLINSTPGDDNVCWLAVRGLKRLSEVRKGPGGPTIC